MLMRKDLTNTVNNLVLQSSRVKIEGKRLPGMAVSTLFPLDQNASDVKVFDTWNKNVQLSQEYWEKQGPCYYLE